MVNIKKQLQAYILLESLIALGVLVTIASLIVGQLGQHQAAVAQRLHQQEVLNVATMAVQTGQSSLSLNGISVQVSRTSSSITVYSEGKEVMSLAKN
ncbi:MULTISPECIES: competence type IV pilus minor pilin ComGE [unclassified Streptococcus]|uniref:competence type IV pilus minor pilin ComGE n=1 Tax=unclassified Streptococcus TaxID=2608887 RepID=UPI00359D8BC0